MFKTAVRAARPAARAARATIKPSGSALRTFSTTMRTQSGGPPATPLYGPGGKPGEVPTDLEQATGLERLQLLGELEGIPIFDDAPLDASRLGTKADPIKVYSLVRDTPLNQTRIFAPLPLVFNSFIAFIGRGSPCWMHWIPRRLSRRVLVHLGEG
jgi:hypothetical protein